MVEANCRCGMGRRREGVTRGVVNIDGLFRGTHLEVGVCINDRSGGMSVKVRGEGILNE